MVILSYEDRVIHLLRRARGRWVDGIRLAQVGGFYGWRSRVSDARRLRGLTIENRQRRTRTRVISEYRIPRKRAA